MEATEGAVDLDDPKWVDPESLETIGDCLAAKESLVRATASIDYQLSVSASLPKSEVDWSWVRRAKYARKMMGLKMQQLQDRISALRRIEKGQNMVEAHKRNESEATCFVEAAKQVLDKETYLEVWDRARALQGGSREC